MPSRGQKQASKANSRVETNSEASSSSSAPSSQHAAPSHASLVDAALKRQKERDARNAEKREKSDELKAQGNSFFQRGDYGRALDVYIDAIDLFGGTAVLNSNAAAAYLKLGQYDSAEDAATDALMRDPKNIKARYRRGLARKGTGNYTGAIAGMFLFVLSIFNALTEQNQTSKPFLSKILRVQKLEIKWQKLKNFLPTMATNMTIAEFSDSGSDSSDYVHVGNRVPCRFYNHGGCARKESCKFSHAPDELSERDKLGRNVCIYYLLDACKYGDAKCSYAHDKSFLPPGWWDDAELVAGFRRKTRDMHLTPADIILIALEFKHYWKRKGKAKAVHIAQGDGASTSTPLAGNDPSYVLLLALDGDVTEDYKLPTISALEAETVVKKALTTNNALVHLASPKLKAVFVADAAIAHSSNARVLTKLVEYARGGGSVVIGGSFSSWINPAEMGDFFKAWGLNWKRGSYHRADFTLNTSHNVVKKSSLPLPDSYSMKALQVQGFEPSGAIYRETGASALESPVVQSLVGKGRVGYIGDVNWEGGSIALLLAMLGLSDAFGKSSSTSTASLKGNHNPANAASRAGGETSGNRDTGSGERYILVLALGGDFDDGVSADYKQPTMNLLKSKSPVKIITTSSDALKLLSSGDIRGVFVADAGITAHKNAQLLTKLVEYTKGGGSVVLGGSFSTFAKINSLGKFFLKSWGVPWQAGSYHRTTFTLNSGHALATVNPSLPKSYSMKALHVKDISADVVVYRPTAESRVESLVFAPTPIDNLAESPAVHARIGQGYLGYIGDVNWEEGSSNLLLAMLDLSNPRSALRPKMGASISTAQPDPSTLSKLAPTTAATTSTLKADAVSFVPSVNVGETKPLAPTTTASLQKRSIMLLSLEDDEYFANGHADLLSAFDKKTTVTKATTVSCALSTLDDPGLGGVFITDAGVIKATNESLLPRLVMFVKSGGTVVVGGSFSSFVSPSEMNKFFGQTWSLPWKSGAYHRTKFSQNAGHDVVTNNPSLPSSYSMKALHLGGLSSFDPVYLPADETHRHFSDHTESPVVMRKIGKGNFGYVGDVNAEADTTTVLLAMLGLLDRPKTVGTAVQHARVQHVSQAEGALSESGEASFRALSLGRTRRPFLMVLSFGNEKFFAGVQGDLLELLKIKLEVLHGLSNERVDELIGSQDLVGILITDAAIARAENAYILSRLVLFAKAGGTVVLGGSFSSNIRFDEMGPFFKNAWDLPWRSGDYTSCEVKVNNKHELIKSSALPSPWYMKGLFLVGVTPQTAVYVPTIVGADNVLQVPIALERVGKGKLGYIGDVGLQDEHSKIVLAMLDLAT
ncbi:hypothetical protein H0H92_010337 [Tricholoma furcatifolium]|nr:hypothetical protein H0H92_010337 [Tricholoma furcatifolium]